MRSTVAFWNMTSLGLFSAWLDAQKFFSSFVPQSVWHTQMGITCFVTLSPTLSSLSPPLHHERVCKQAANQPTSEWIPLFFSGHQSPHGCRQAKPQERERESSTLLSRTVRTYEYKYRMYLYGGISLIHEAPYGGGRDPPLSPKKLFLCPLLRISVYYSIMVVAVDVQNIT